MSRSFTQSTDDYLHTDTLAVSAYPVTVSLRYKPTATSFTKSSGLWSLGDKDISNSSFLFINHSGDTADKISVLWGDPLYVGQSSTGTPTQDVWNHIVAIWESASVVSVFLNGSKDRGTGIGGAAWGGGGTWDSTRIGAWVRPSHDNAEGLINDVAVWNVVLTDEEAAALNAGASPLSIRTASLKSYVPFLGRNSPEIDIISGATYTVTGSAAANSDEPPVSRAVGKRTRPFLPVNYGGQSLRFRKPGSVTGDVDNPGISLFRCSAYTNSSPISGYPFTLSCNFTTGDISGNQWPTLFGLMEKASGSGRHVVVIDGGDSNIGGFEAASTSGPPNNYATTTSTTDVVAGQWHHGCGVFAAAQDHRAYLDGGGKTVNTTQSQSFGSLIDCVYFGKIGDQGYSPFDGRIMWPAIWNVALTDNEVLQLAQGADPRTVRPGSLVFFIPDIGRDRQPIDIIGGLKLTIVGATPDDSTPRVARLGRLKKGNVRSWADPVPPDTFIWSGEAGVERRFRAR